MKRGLVIVLLILISLSFVTAGFFDWVKEKVQLSPFNTTLTITNNPPTIISWTEPLDSGSSYFFPTCNSTTTIGDGDDGIFNVTVLDLNGCNDIIDDGNVTVYFYYGATFRNGGTIPEPIQCDTPDSCSGNLAVFNCSGKIDMYYYDNWTSNWIINISANDGTDPANNSGVESDGSGEFPFFTYSDYVCEYLRDDNDPTEPLSTIEYPNVNAATKNQSSLTNLTLENQGNTLFDQADYFLQMKGDKLLGTGGNTDAINETSFEIDEIDGCHGVGRQTITQTDENITGAFLPVGIVTQPTTTEEFYFCLEEMDLNQSGLAADTYSSQASPNEWRITFCELC